MPPMADPINSSIAVTAPDIALGSALCTACGLCCTGALHNFAVLEPEEIDFARGIGLTLRTEGRPGFALPCPFLQNSCCTIYADRPKVCARYKCGLLENLEAGSTRLDAALATVAAAKQLLSRAQSMMADGMTIPAARALSRELPIATVDAGARTADMKLRLAMTALSLFLDKYFKNSREGKLLTLEVIADQRPDTEMR